MLARSCESYNSVSLSVRPSVRLSHACFVTNPKNLPTIFFIPHERAILLVKCDFSYSCAATDKISTDLRALAVSLRQLSYLLKWRSSAVLDFQKCESSTAGRVHSDTVCQYAKFTCDMFNCCMDMMIYRIQASSRPPSWIFKKFEILTDVMVQMGNVRNHAKFGGDHFLGC